MHEESDPDVGWVASLAGRPVSTAKAAVEEARSECALFAHLRKEHAREGRESYVEIDAPLELYSLVRLVRPRHVVEVGVASGVSSAYLLKALARNGRGTLHSIDRPSRPRWTTVGSKRPRVSWTLPEGRATGWAIPPELTRTWDLHLGEKTETLPKVVGGLPSIELFVYDVPHDDRTAHRDFAPVDLRMPTGAVAIVDHGPGGGSCPALQRWARRRHSSSSLRVGLGLAGMRAGGRPRRPGTARPMNLD